MVRQYQIPGLRYLANLCFVDQKLVIEIDEDGHPYYENDETRQKLKILALLLLELILILILMQVLI